MFNKVKEKVDSSEELDRMTVDSCQYYEKIIRNNIEVYKANSEVLKLLTNRFLRIRWNLKLQNEPIFKRNILKIDELYVYLINEGENKNRDIFSFTHRLLNDLGDMSSSSNVIIDDNYILRLSKIVENLEIYHKQHSDVYDTNVCITVK